MTHPRLSSLWIVGLAVMGACVGQVASAPEQYEIVGAGYSLITPDSIMTSLGCSALAIEEPMSRPGSMLRIQTGAGEVRRFDCTDVSRDVVLNATAGYRGS